MAVTQAQHVAHTNALRDLVAKFFTPKPGKINVSKGNVSIRTPMPAPTKAPYRNALTPNQKTYGAGVGP